MVVIPLSVGYNELAEREYCSGQALGTYNSFNQLKTVSDGTNTASYNYDNGGNITSKTVNGTTISYGYGDTNWTDKLTSYNGQSITYDNLGNPLSYRGMTMDWTGRRLDSIVSNGTTSSYLYDANGIRTRKTVDSTMTEYFTSGSTILAEKTGSDVIWYIYDSDDSDGEVLGFTYNGTPYYYLKNQQGDVYKVVNTSGSVVASYTYDAWGKVTAASGSMANVNPIRYRSYYYDTETGLYYVSSRYYDPETCRFINADDTDTLTATMDDVTDKNLFAYCDNNPIMRMDDDGEFWKEIGLAVGITAGIVAVGALVVATGGLAAVAVAGGGTMLVATSTTTAALGVATVAGKVALGGILVHATAATAEKYISYSKSKSDPYARPGQKKQGRENKNKSRTKDTYKPRNNRRDKMPAKPKTHHPSNRGHRKY